MEKEAEEGLEKAVEAPVSPPKKRGRPRKADVLAKTKGHRKAVGRPKGDAAIMNDYKARLLNSRNAPKVVHKIFEVALEDGHPHQAACMKMIADRLLPVKAFEQEVVEGKGAGGLNITITSVGGNVQVDEAVEAEFKEVREVTDDER